MKQEGHDPGRQRSDENDDERVAQALESTPEIELREIDATGDERKARDDKQHRADVACLMNGRKAEKKLREAQ